MKLRLGELDICVGYEAVAAMTAALLLDRENRIICCFAAALLHELGHILMMKRYHIRIRGLRLRLFDVLIEADEPPTFWADIAVTSGGVCMNLLCAVLLTPLSIKLGAPHIFLGAFNLLPILSLDGGHLLELCLMRRVSQRISQTVLRITTFISILPLMTAGILFLLRSRYNYSLLAISLYLLILIIKD